jgi:hypothetical protein
MCAIRRLTKRMQRTPKSVILFAYAKRPPLSGAADARRWADKGMRRGSIEAFDWRAEKV